MKKITKYLFTFLGLFIIASTGVNALEINKDDIQKGTYVIGSYMFTRDTNSDYNGQLTTKLIMLAAKTIQGDSLDDMVIYYKNARGNWTDAISGEEIQVADKVEVEYTNTRIQLNTPLLATDLSAFGTDGFGTFSFAYNVTNLDNATGVEVYSKTGIDGEYSLLTTTLVSDLTNINDTEHGITATNAVQLLYKKGYNSYYKIRTYKVYGEEKVYSNFSNEINIYKTIETPTISFTGMGADADGIIGKEIEVTPLNGDLNIYYSTSENGSYQLLRKVSMSEYTNDTYAESRSVYVPKGYHYYYKARLSYTYGEDTLYGEYSNVLDIYNTLVLEKTFGGLNAEDSIMATDLCLKNYTLPEGVQLEIYHSNTMNGQYSLVDTLTSEEYYSHFISGTENSGVYYTSNKLGIDNFYKVRLVTTTSDGTIYSEFSNIVDTSYLLSAPTLTENGVVIVKDTNSRVSVLDFTAEGYYYNNECRNEIKGLELYEKNGELYTLVETVVFEEGKGWIGPQISILEGQKKTFVVKVYTEDNDSNKIYSYYSNELVIDRTES